MCHSVYKTENIEERHRHRYELNNKYLNQLEENGLVASGKNKDTNLVEVVEVKEHPWFIGVQYHPEYKVLFYHLIHYSYLLLVQQS
ncbi:MAG: hypothetical protein CM15mP36_11460 [Flavobacteriales bacterium]|nr:MAG: hypothetical protein CM15mP36_11460 [Flavobacteriales bacterium]